jgi:TPP-dependent pyruvate/acetoin dehydrogenase alpha subunit
MTSVRLDGNDVIAIYEAADAAVRCARAGEGPTLFECVTYRTRAHSEGMRDAGYRTRDEVDAWKERDPIKRLRERLLDERIASADELDRIDEKVQAIVEEAHEFAKNSPWPDPTDAATHIYSE